MAEPKVSKRGRRVLGCAIALVFLAPMGAWMFGAVRASQRTALEAGCKEHLAQIGAGFAEYRKRFSAWPPDVASAQREGLADAALWTCPVTHGTYEYKCPAADAKPQPGTFVAWDRDPHPDGRRCILYLDGFVDMLDNRTFSRARK